MSVAQLVIPPKSGRALRLKRGEVLRVTDLEGTQVADLVAFSTAGAAEYFSQGFTRVNNDKAVVSIGDHLFSNLNVPMLTVVADTVGVHDMLFPPCSQFLYEHVFSLPGKTGCREHLTTALQEHAVGFDRVTDPFNVFMNTEIGDDGAMLIHPAPSGAGDYLELQAEMDLLVAVSACAADVTDCNGGVCTSIGLDVHE